MKQSQRIAKNTAFGLLSAVVGGGLQFVSILVAARFLGVVQFGTFSYLLAFASVFQFLADFGLGNILIREIAGRPQELERLLAGARSLMWMFTGMTLLLMSVLIFLLPLDLEMRKLSLVMGVAYLMLLQSVSYVSVLRATEHMEYQAIGFSGHKALLVLFLVVVLGLHGGLWGAVWCHFAANVCQVFYYRLMVGRRFGGIRKFFAWDPALWKFLARETVPLGAGLVLRQFSWQTEVFLLKYLAAPMALGLFSGSYRFLIGLTLFSAVLTNPLFPVFVRLEGESRELLAEAYRRAVRWFCMLALPAVAVCVAWPHTLVLLFLGKSFLPAAHLLRWLGLAIVPIILTALYPVLYSTLHETGRYLAAMGGMALLRVLLGSWLILYFGNRGACGSVVFAEAALFLVLAGGLRRLGLHLDRMREMIRLLLPFAVMLSVLWLLRHQPLSEQIVIGPAAFLLYGALLWRLKNFSIQEIGLIREGAGFCRLYFEGLVSKRKAHA